MLPSVGPAWSLVLVLALGWVLELGELGAQALPAALVSAPPLPPPPQRQQLHTAPRLTSRAWRTLELWAAMWSPWMLAAARTAPGTPFNVESCLR